MTNLIYGHFGPLYNAKNINVCPVREGTKAGVSDWNGSPDQPPNPKKLKQWLEQYPSCGIGLLCGGMIGTDYRLLAVDIDDDRYVDVITRMIGGIVSGKKGRRGLTTFVRGDVTLKKKAQIKCGETHILDLLTRNCLCVLPPSIHPDTGLPYEWIGQSLLECDLNELPILTAEKFAVMQAIFNNPNHKELI